MRNVFPLGYPWECDVVKIQPTGYFAEYGIKISKEDFKKDFQKTGRMQIDGRFSKTKKHEFLASTEKFESCYRNQTLLKPKNFYFVVPEDLKIRAPSHTGLIIFYPKGNSWDFEVENYAPTLPNAEKMNFRQIYNMAQKVQTEAGIIDRAIQNGQET